MILYAVLFDNLMLIDGYDPFLAQKVRPIVLKIGQILYLRGVG